MHQPDQLKESTLMSQSESETTLCKSDTTDKEDQSRVFHKVTLSIEEVEPEEMTDQEREEETSETFKTNFTEINSKNHNKESQLPLQSNKYLKNNKNLRNPKR